MIKLQDILNEQEFKAKSKETGRVVVYKSKENMDKAIKGGKAEPLDKKTGDKPEKVKGADLFKKDTKKSDEPKSDTSQDSGKNSPRQDRLQASKIVRMSSHGNKLLFNKDKETYATSLDDTLQKIMQHAEKMNDDNVADEFYTNAEDLSQQLSQATDAFEKDEIEKMDFKDDAYVEARKFINHYENSLTKNKQSSPTASVGYRTGKNRGGGMYDNVNKSSNKKLQEIIEKTTNI